MAGQGLITCCDGLLILLSCTPCRPALVTPQWVTGWQDAEYMRL